MIRSTVTLLVLLLACGRAHAAAGDLDPAFGTGGSVLLARPGPSARATDVHALADGRLLVAAGGRVYRLLPDGTPDATFGHRGRAARLHVSAERLALQADGRILVGGRSQRRHPLQIARLTAAGRADRSFGRHGTVAIDERPRNDSRQVVVDAQARIVVLALDIPDGAVVRLLPDGGRDAGFGANGVVVEPQFAGSAFTALAVRPDGRILAAVGGALVRYLDDGRRDPDFGPFHTGVTALGRPFQGARATALFPLDDDRILAVGGVIRFPYIDFDGVGIGRLLPDGSPDSTFGAFGWVTVPVNEYAFATGAARLADGRIVAVGYDSPDEDRPDSDYFVARFLPDGTLDPSFGSAGVATAALGAAPEWSEQATAVSVQPDGGLVATVTVIDPSTTADDRAPVWGRVVRHLGD